MEKLLAVIDCLGEQLKNLNINHVPNHDKYFQPQSFIRRESVPDWVGPVSKISICGPKNKKQILTLIWIQIDSNQGWFGVELLAEPLDMLVCRVGNVHVLHL